MPRTTSKPRHDGHTHGHEGHDHDHVHDHEGHDHTHQHGPVLNPDCTRELVLDIPADEVSKAYKQVTGNYRKYAKIPGFRAGKVPESVVRAAMRPKFVKMSSTACCRSASTRQLPIWVCGPSVNRKSRN